MNFAELMNSYKINDDSCNQKVYDALLSQLKNNRVIPVIGAGLSVWAGYPLWQSFLKEKSDSTPVRDKINEYLVNFEFEKAASTLDEFYKHNTFLAAIKDTFSPVKIKENNRPQYQLKLLEICNGPVVTTNYDVCLERMLSDPYVITPEDSYNYSELLSRIQLNERVIIKLHGTIHDPEHIIITSERYSEVYGLKKSSPDIFLPLPRTLSSIFSSAPPFFVGCGLNGDRTCDVFRNCIGTTGFALLELPEETQNIENPLQPRIMDDTSYIRALDDRLDYLDKLNIKVIWYPWGLHDAVGVLIDQLYADLFDKKNEHKNKTGIKYIKNRISEFVKKKEKIVRSFGLMPVLNTQIAFDKAFPDLFIKPNLLIDGNAIKYQEFTEKYDKRNVVILGDAGSGKSTLLKYMALFENKNALYVTAQDIEEDNRIIKDICILGENDPTIELLLLIDGLDEVYWNDIIAYKKLIGTISTLTNNVHCWLASRRDFYMRTYSEGTFLTNCIVEIEPWGVDDHARLFLCSWARVFNQEAVPDIVDSWAKKSDSIIEMMSNPFQLTLLAFLAGFPNDLEPIYSTYDLYYQFFIMWYTNEEKRKKRKIDRITSNRQLVEAAEKIYEGKKYLTKSIHNTEVTDLLIWNEGLDHEGNYVSSMFRHHSLAAFLLALQLFDAMKSGDKQKLDNALNRVIKDDVTNFVIRKAENMSDNEIDLLKQNLSRYYYDLPNGDTRIGIREKVIYYMSRFKGDCSKFLITIVNKKSPNPHIRLSLAYACSLTENRILRKYALSYAKSLAANKEDARVNRAWTLVYYGDSNKNPYEYRDEENGPWKNAREARLKRFLKEKPRVKDYRFLIFDLPLFHTFLLSRNWNDISEGEYDIIAKLNFPDSRFNRHEIKFLNKKKEELLSDYKWHLAKENGAMPFS